MKDVPHQNALAVQFEDSGTAAENWNEGIIAHPNRQTRDRLVADKTTLVRDHMVRSPSVGDRETSTRNGGVDAEVEEEATTET